MSRRSGLRETTFERRIARTAQGSYLLYKPAAPQAEPRPLVLCLQGIGERGDRLDLLRIHDGPPKRLDEALAARNVSRGAAGPAEERFSMTTLLALLDHLVSEAGVDTRRVYPTGLSMGAEAAWQLASEAPDRFAALVPICGRSLPRRDTAVADTHLGVPWRGG